MSYYFCPCLFCLLNTSETSCLVELIKFIYLFMVMLHATTRNLNCFTNDQILHILKLYLHNLRALSLKVPPRASIGFRRRAVDSRESDRWRIMISCSASTCMFLSCQSVHRILAQKRKWTRSLTVYLSLTFSCPRFSPCGSRISHPRWRVWHLLRTSRQRSSAKRLKQQSLLPSDGVWWRRDYTCWLAPAHKKSRT